MTVDITVVLTSCNRPDLLAITLESFFRFNDYPIRRFIVIEDSEYPGVPDLIRAEYADRVELIVNAPRIGQIRSIDRVYQMIDTEYVFHCEDDWRFFRQGFIADSVEILRENPQIHQVQLRDLWANNGHPPERASLRTADGVAFRLMSRNFRAPNGLEWHGFTFNPGLRRLAEYRAMGPYERIGHEEHINDLYDRQGLRAAILEESAVEHIGDNRHVLDINEAAPSRALSLQSHVVNVLRLLLPPIVIKLVKHVRRLGAGQPVRGGALGQTRARVGPFR